MLIILWTLLRKVVFVKLLGLLWAGLALLVVVVGFVQVFTTKMKVTKGDIYGKYVIDKSKFPGEQAEWQYDNFKFEITKDNVFYFTYKNSSGEYETEVVPVEFLEHYYSDRLVIDKDSTRHHIIVDNPTLYRDVWTFYYVFESDKFGNVFFKKKGIFD